MATSERDLSATVLGGSDELFDFNCQPCSTESLNVEAAGFCQQCHEYLCDDCIRYHRKFANSKNHSILDKEDMPKTTLAPRVTDTLTETCLKHAGKVLEYFCNDHGEICCSVCLNLDHSSCKNKSYIPDISNGTSASQEYKELVEELDILVAMATSEQMQIKLNANDNQEYRTRSLANIRQCRKEMDKLFDQIVDGAVQNVTILYKANEDEIKAAEHNCQLVLSDVESIATDLKKKAHAIKNSQLFVDIKLARNRLPALEKAIQDVTDRKISHFKFDKDERVQALRSTLTDFFTLSVEKEARYLQEVNVKSAEDEKDCNIVDIAVVAGERLVITDTKNEAIKLVDVRQSRVISRLPMSSMPLAATRIAPNKVAVAQGQQIDILTVSDVLVKSKTINMPGITFSHMCYMNEGNTLLGLCSVDRVLKIVDMTGRVLSTVYKDKDTDPIFKSPRYVALSRGQDLLYVTDAEADTVTTMTGKGRVISIYKHADLQYPLGVAVARDGAVYVSSFNNQYVHQLSATGQHAKVLLDGQRKLEEYPQAIAYDEDNNRLCISSVSTNFVRLFQLQ